jgi:hypothetical protein
MERRIACVLAALFAAFVSGCEQRPVITFHSADFFPLLPNMAWTYRVTSRSQHTTYAVTDEVVGNKYIPSLELTGSVVQEFYDFDRGGMRPIVYYERRGYFARFSGLDYEMREIDSPMWGRSEEMDFLPERLAPDQAWNNTLFPYGRLPGSFNITQSHQTFFDPNEIMVPAGRFGGCIRIETAARYHGGLYDQQKQALALSYEDWYAPNVGLVLTVAHEGTPNGPEIERVELLHFARDARRAVAREQEPSATPHS